MGALDQLRSATDEDGLAARARSNPRLLLTIVAGAILVVAWIAWAIHVTSSDGASAGLGVLIAWPAILAALALVSLPFIGAYLLIRRLADGGGETATAEADESEEPEEDADEEPEEDEDEEPEGDEQGDSDEDTDENSEEGEDSDDESESDSEAEASAAN